MSPPLPEDRTPSARGRSPLPSPSPTGPPPDTGSGAAPAEPADSAVAVFRDRLEEVEEAVSNYFLRRRDGLTDGPEPVTGGWWPTR